MGYRRELMYSCMYCRYNNKVVARGTKPVFIFLLNEFNRILFCYNENNRNNVYIYLNGSEVMHTYQKYFLIYVSVNVSDFFLILSLFNLS